MIKSASHSHLIDCTKCNSMNVCFILKSSLTNSGRRSSLPSPIQGTFQSAVQCFVSLELLNTLKMWPKLSIKTVAFVSFTRYLWYKFVCRVSLEKLLLTHCSAFPGPLRVQILFSKFWLFCLLSSKTFNWRLHYTMVLLLCGTVGLFVARWEEFWKFK